MKLALEDLRSFLASRRSVRRFQTAPVPAEVLRRILEAATLAPSAHNRQPWRFAVIQDQGARRSLASAMSSRFLEDLRRDGVGEEEANQRAARSRERILSAPALIAVCLTMAEMDSYPDTLRRKAEYLMAVQSTALATGNLLLAIHAEGLAACWMCAPLFVPDVVGEALRLPADWEPQALIVLGSPRAIPSDPGRRPVDEVVEWR